MCLSGFSLGRRKAAPGGTKKAAAKPHPGPPEGAPRQGQGAKKPKKPQNPKAHQGQEEEDEGCVPRNPHPPTIAGMAPGGQPYAPLLGQGGQAHPKEALAQEFSVPGLGSGYPNRPKPCTMGNASGRGRGRAQGPTPLGEESPGTIGQGAS
jgi:hypothetical protein